MSNGNYRPVRVKDVEQEEKEVIVTPEPEVKPVVLDSIDVKEIAKKKLKFGCKEAIELLLAGERIKLPEWKGQWKAVGFIYNGETKHIIRVVFEDGSTADTPIIEYLLRNDFELVAPDEYI